MTWFQIGCWFDAALLLIVALVCLRHYFSARLVPRDKKLRSQMFDVVSVALAFCAFFVLAACKMEHPVHALPLWVAALYQLMLVGLAVWMVFFYELDSIDFNHRWVGWEVSWGKDKFHDGPLKVVIRPYHTTHYVSGYRERTLEGQNNATGMVINIKVQFLAHHRTEIQEFDAMVDAVAEDIKRELDRLARSVNVYSCEIRGDGDARARIEEGLGQIQIRRSGLNFSLLRAFRGEKCEVSFKQPEPIRLS